MRRSVIGLALVLSLALAPSSHAFIYWTRLGATPIGRANNDGSGVNRNFIKAARYPEDITVDGSHVYWADYGSGAIGRANLDGSAVDQAFIVTAGHRPEGIAVDSGHVYWTNEDGGPGTTIGRANVNGTGVDENFLGGLEHPLDVAVDAAHVYWTSSNAIGRANLDGSGVNTNFIPFIDPASETHFPSPHYLAVDGSHVYWDSEDQTCGAPGSIGRADLDGGNVNRGFINFSGNQGCPLGLAVDGAHIYWAGVFGDFRQAIGRANLDGGAANAGFINGLDGPYGVAVDGRSGGSAPSGQVQLSRLVISPRAFAAARSGTTVRTAAHATGARVSYKLSGPASVHFTVARPVAGRRGRGGRCVAPTRTNRRARRCTRLAGVGRFTVSGHAGQNRLRFTGRVAGRALKRAAYRLTATPVAAGRSGRGATVAFRITG